MESAKQEKGERILRWLIKGGAPAPSLAVIVAHPDDETIGIGARLHRLGEALFIFVTDGAPRDLADARAAGYNDRAGYARARRAELSSVLAQAGIAPEVKFLDCIDQEASLALAALARQFTALLARCDAVLTQPYEGGHPDHDATACAVQLACRRLQRSGRAAPIILEMAGYHRGMHGLETGGFLPQAGCREWVAPLSAAQRQQKRRLLDGYVTQRRMLAAFAVDVERFRTAPRYDFGAPPHAGPLYYETLDWPMSGARWRALAQSVEEEILWL